MIFIDALDQVFPDARYWMTHRDVAKVIPSVVDLYHELSRPYVDKMDTVWMAEMAMNWTELGLKRIEKFRANGNDHRFLDVDFAEVQASPISVIERLYSFLSEPLSDEVRKRILAWREEMPAGKHGQHSYDPVDLGIDMAVLSRRFSFYNVDAGKVRVGS